MAMMMMTQTTAQSGECLRVKQLENSSTPVGYTGQAAISREQCNMTPKTWNNGVKIDGHY
jgi:hypothetical protein